MPDAMPASKRGRFRLSVRRLLVLVAIAALGLGWYGRSVREQAAALAALTEAGGTFLYDWEDEALAPAGGYLDRSWAKPGPVRGWFCRHLGPDSVGRVISAEIRHGFPNDGDLGGSLAAVGRLRGISGLNIDIEISSLEMSRDPATYEPLRNLRHLEWLHLGMASPNCQVALDRLSGCRDLRSLRIDVRDDRDDLSFEALSAFRRLETLSLDRTNVDDRTLAALRGISTLRELSLNRCPVTAAGLSHLEAATELETVSLFRTLVEDLGPLRRSPKLRMLNVSETPLDDRGFGPRCDLPALVQLRLDSTSITDRTLARLAEGCPQLARLDLDRTKIGDAGLDHLALMPKLREVSLSETTTTGEGIAALRRLRPDLLISR